MKRKKKYSQLEAEILSTLKGCFSLKDIPEQQNNVWLEYAKREKTKKKYDAYRRRKRYPRNESIYNKGQEDEFLIFLEYLGAAVNYACMLK